MQTTTYESKEMTDTKKEIINSLYKCIEAEVNLFNLLNPRTSLTISEVINHLDNKIHEK